MRKDPPKRLIMRLGHLGDVVLVSGIIHYFGTRWNCDFDILTREQWAPLFLHHPHVGRVISASNHDLRGVSLLRYLRQIRSSYSATDILYDLHGVLRSRLLAAIWPGEVRKYQKFGLERRLFMLSNGKIGGDRLRAKSVLQRYATAFVPDEASSQRATGYIPEFDLLPKLYLAEEEKNWAAGRIASLTPNAGTRKQLVAIHPFATHQNKSWPAPMWKALTAQFDSKGIPWIAVGASTEEQALAWPGNNSFVNKTSLRETMALLSQSQVLITGDSGPLHLARGVRTKVVGLFGPTVKEWGFFPTAEEGIVLETDRPCRPCSLHGAKPCRHDGMCLKDITPAHVLEATQTLLRHA